MNARGCFPLSLSVSLTSMTVEAENAKEVIITALWAVVEAFGADSRGMIVVWIAITPPIAVATDGILERNGNSSGGEEGDDGEELHFHRFDGLFQRMGPM